MVLPYGENFMLQSTRVTVRCRQAMA